MNVFVEGYLRVILHLCIYLRIFAIKIKSKLSYRIQLQCVTILIDDMLKLCIYRTVKVIVKYQ